jgi:cytosine permease
MGAKAETAALSRIPDEQRQNWTSIAFIWIGTMICIPMLMVGGIFSATLTLVNTIWAAVIGFAVCSLVMVFGGMMATDLGLPSSMCATKAYGDKGASFVTSLIVFIAQLGWFGIQTATCATAFGLLTEFLGFTTPFWLSCVIWGVIMLVTAVYGFSWMKWLNYIAVPALFLMCLYGIIDASTNYGWANLFAFVPAAENTMSMTAAISTVIGLFAVGTVINADYTRYAKSRAQTVAATFVGVLPAAVIMIFTGAVMALSSGQYDISLVFANMGIPVLGMLVLVLATWTTNTANAYTAGLAAMKVFSLKDNRRPLVTMICGAVGIVIAIAGLANVLTNFVTIMGSLVPPVAGVFIADYWVVCKGKPQNWQPVRGINWCGITAWLCGCAVAVFASFFSPALDGIIVSFVAYIILHYALGKTKFGGNGSMSIDEIEAELK